MSYIGYLLMGILIGAVYALIAASVIALGALLIYAIDRPIINLCVKNIYDREDALDNLIVFLFAATIIIALCFGMYYGIPTTMIETAEWDEPVNYVTHTIVNLADNNEIEGRIRGRYVRGYIGETTTYHYYYKQYDGGLKLQKAGEKNTTIYYTDTEPRAEWYRQTRRFWGQEETKYYCKIYIPEGSMTTEFEIDME